MTPKPKVLLFGGESGNPTIDAELRQVADVHVIPRTEPEELAQVVKDAVETYGPFEAFAATVKPGEPVPFRWKPDVFKSLAPHCKCYCRLGAGYDDVDVEFLTSTGAMFANAPTVIGQRTANGAVMLTLAAFGGLLQQDQSVRGGGWHDRTVPTRAWSDSTVGIIGMGKIGARIGRILSSLDMTIIYNNRRKVPESPFEYATLDEVYSKSDAIIVACPLTEETKHMLNKETFAKMKDGVIIVNIGRGACIDEAALVDALESRKVLRAALDVFENEPNPHPGLISSPYTTLSPHAALGPDTVYVAGNTECLENVIQYIKTGKPNTPVNLVELEKAGFSFA